MFINGWRNTLETCLVLGEGKIFISYLNDYSIIVCEWIFI